MLGLLLATLLPVHWYHITVLERSKDWLGQQPVQRASLSVPAAHGDKLTDCDWVVTEYFPAVPVRGGERQIVRDANAEVQRLLRRPRYLLVLDQDIAFLAGIIRIPEWSHPCRPAAGREPHSCRSRHWESSYGTTSFPQKEEHLLRDFLPEVLRSPAVTCTAQGHEPPQVVHRVKSPRDDVMHVKTRPSEVR